MKRNLLIVLVVTLWATACATHSLPRQASTSGDRLTREDFSDTDYTTAFDAVRSLRPEWLTPLTSDNRPGSSGAYPKIVLGGVNVGDVTSLLAIRLSGVETMHFLDSGRAVSEFGPDFQAGVINIEPRHGDRLD